MRRLLLLLFLLSSLPAWAWQSPSGKIAPRLEHLLLQQPEQPRSVYIWLANEYDINALAQRLEREGADLQRRAREVITHLRTHARKTQAPLLQWLRQQPGVDTSTIRPFWVANLVFATLAPDAIRAAAARPDVQLVDLNAPLALESWKREEAPQVLEAPTAPGAAEPGLVVIHAPEMWAMGYTGYGRVAFTNDTGVHPDEPAIRNQFRGITAPPEWSWFSYEGDELQPYDCGDHGTHVTGTILGLDRTNDDTIGVAFNAQWVGAAILCGIGTADNVAAFEWALDPDGNPDTFEDMPDVINNSWYDPSIDDPCDNIYVPILTALEAAGIAVVFSAGNEGPEAGTITNPHNINVNLVNAFTVGALNGNVASLPIANFSSRGPSACPGTGSIRIKPEVSAPGVQVRSCVGGGYDYYSGTSMASPHVAGAILLLKEAFPYLTGYDLKMALYQSATDLGAPGEDNYFGMGVINVKAAFDTLVAQGYEPVDPHAEHDLLLIDVVLDEYYCGGQADAVVHLSDEGTDTIYQFEIRWHDADSTVVGAWAWHDTLPPLGRLAVQVPAFDLPEGRHDLWFELVAPNGAPDQRPLNNRLRKTLNALTRSPLAAQWIAIDSARLCKGGQALLRASSDTRGVPTFYWYTSESATTPVGEGAAWLTPPLSQNATWWLDAEWLHYAGLQRRDDHPYALIDADEEGMVFDCYHPFRLKAVWVYADETGARIIQLQDADGNSLGQKVVFIDETGFVRVPLGFNVPSGMGLRLVKVAGKDLYANTAGVTGYPFVVDDILAITGNTAEPNAWYYFYKWEVSYEELCGRTAVTVEVDTAGASPVAAFAKSADTLDLTQGPAWMDFYDESVGAASWLWLFGDGGMDVLPEPQHTYDTAGTFVVSLTIADSVGCMASALDTVVVVGPFNTTATTEQPADEVRLALWPVPASHRVLVQLPEVAGAAQVTVFDALGRVVHRQETRAAQLELDVSAWQPGVYLVRWQHAQTWRTGRLIRQ